MTDDDFINIYASYSTQDTQRLCEILRGAGIELLTRDRGSSSFPTNVGTTAQMLIAVMKPEAARSKELINAAIEDGVISGDGEHL